MIIAFMTFLQIPILEHIGASFLLQNYRDTKSYQSTSNAQNEEEPSSAYLWVLFVITLANAFLFLILSYLIVRIYTIRLPNNKIFWAASSTQLHAMKVVNKIALVACHLYLTVMDDSKNDIFVIVALTLLFGVVSLMRIMLIPHYKKVIDWIIRLTELLTTCLLFILLVAHGIAQDWGKGQDLSPIISDHILNSSMPQNITSPLNMTVTSSDEGPKTTTKDFGLCLLISFVTIPCIVGLAYVLDYHRQKQLWQKLEKNELKHEIEMEHGLYLLIQKLQTAIWSNKEIEGMDALADLLYLIEVHNMTCENFQCPCHRKEIVGYLLNKSHTYHTRTITLQNEEVSLLNSQVPNKFIKSIDQIDSVKTLTFLQFYYGTQVNGGSGNLRGSFSNTIDEQMLQRDQSVTPSSSKMLEAENTNQGYKVHNQNASEDSNMFVNVNIPSLKATFLNQFAETYFEEAKRRFPQSKKLFYQYANFTLHCCKNRYMTESLIRNIWSSPHTHSDWIEKVSTHVNELYTIMEVEKYPYREAQQSTSAAANFDDNIVAQSDFVNWGVSYFSTSDKHNRHLKESSGRLQHGPNSLEWLQPEQFILITELTEEFNDQVDKLARSVQYFWKLVQSDSFDVYHAQKAGILMADTIAEVYSIFKKIEDVSNEGKIGVNNGQNDSRICFTFALMQKYLLNDITQHDLYIAKMNSQREMRRLIRNNMLSSSKEGIEETGFLLVKGQMQRFGEVIICNQVFRKYLGYTQADQQHLNIVDFMPTQIKGWHNQFVQDFCQSGGASSVMLNNTTCVFLKQKSGYIIPAMIHLKFNYSPHCGTNDENSITFAMFTSFIQELRLFRSTFHSIKDVMIFICNDQDGQILDVSDSCNSILKISSKYLGGPISEACDMNSLRIEDLFPSMPPMAIIVDMVKQQQVNPTASYEIIIDVDFDIIAKLNGGFRRRTSQQKSQQQQKGILSAFTEQYGLGSSIDSKRRSLLIFAVSLVDQNTSLKHYSMDVKKLSQQRSSITELQVLGQSQIQENNDASPEQMREMTEENHMSQISQEIEDAQSQSSTSHQSGNGSISESAQLKQMQASTEKTASGSLKLITQLIFGVFLLLLVLSTVNLTLSLDRYGNLQHEVNIVRRSYDRIQIRAKLRILLRGMLIAANGYGTTDEKRKLARFKEVQIEFKDAAMKLKECQQYLDQNTMEFRAGKYSLNSKTVELRYLDADNNEQVAYESLSYAMNVYVQRVTDMMNWPIERYKVNIRVMQLTDPPQGYRPTDDERTIYFITQSAMGNLRTETRKVSESLRDETEENALSVAQTTQLTIIISIVAIGIVCLIVSPILCRIEERKFMSLRFFLNVEHQHLTMLDKQVILFQHLAFHENNKIEQESRKSLLETIKDEGEPNIEEMLSIEDSQNSQFENTGNVLLGSNQYAQKDSHTRKNSNNLPTKHLSSNLGKWASRGKNSVSPDPQFEEESNSRIIIGGNAQIPFSFVQNHNQPKSPTAQIKPMNQQVAIKLEDIKLEENNSDSYNEIKKENTQKKKNRKNSVKIAELPGKAMPIKKEEESNSESNKDDEDYEQSEKSENTQSQEQRKDMKAMKQHRISQVICRQKIISAFIIFFISMLFCSYFIAVYFLSVKPFQQTSEILDYLDQIYQKDYNLGVAIAFIRENYVWNVTFGALEDPSEPASTHYLEITMKSEEKYRQMRKNIPDIFDSIRDYFERIESSEVCALAFYDDPPEVKVESIQTCSEAVNGIMLQGLSVAMSIMIRHFIKINMNFLDRAPIERTLQFIKDGIKDPDTIEYVDLKNLQIDSAINGLKNQATYATAYYYAALIDQYTILFSIFVAAMALMCVVFIIYGYNRIKDVMWKTNLTLKIMPLDFVPKESLPELKAFYQF